MQKVVYSLALLFCVSIGTTTGFDVTRNDNLAVYWGQNSYGVTHPSDTANQQQTLSFYCADNSIDVFPVAFLDVFFSTDNLPQIDLSNICGPNGAVFPGTQLANCQFLASDIQTCQSKGKIVTLSLGGGAASGVTFSSASQAQAFADQIWNLFLGGSSSTRPFGNAVLDGVDLDIEGGGTTFYDSFVNQIRSHATGASKKYYISGAPQCPYPDAYMQSVLNAVGFDMVYVQFYNNYCGVANYDNPNDWDFSVWDNWAKTVSPNKNVKVYIGIAAGPLAASSGSYVDSSALVPIIQQTSATYSSFGGVMMWDASQAYMNNRYDAAVKSILTGGSVPVPPSSTPPPTTTHPPTTSAPAPSSTHSAGDCAGVAAWSSGVAYTGGQQAVYNGHLWTAKWWSQGDTPGGSAGDWTDDGACTSTNVQTAVASVSHASSSVQSAGLSAKPVASHSSVLHSATATASTKARKSSRFFRL